MLYQLICGGCGLPNLSTVFVLMDTIMPSCCKETAAWPLRWHQRTFASREMLSSSWKQYDLSVRSGCVFVGLCFLSHVSTYVYAPICFSMCCLSHSVALRCACRYCAKMNVCPLGNGIVERLTAFTFRCHRCAHASTVPSMSKEENKAFTRER